MTTDRLADDLATYFDVPRTVANERLSRILNAQSMPMVSFGFHAPIPWPRPLRPTYRLLFNHWRWFRDRQMERPEWRPLKREFRLP